MFKEAEIMSISLRRQRHVQADAHFLPIFQYPLDSDVDIMHGEIGALVKMTGNGEITKVMKRIVVER